MDVTIDGILYSVTKTGVTVKRLVDKTMKNIIIPYEIQHQTVNKIGHHAFANIDIEDIQIPSTIKEIAPSAFRNCSNLTEVFQCGKRSTSALAIGEDAFKNCTNLLALSLKKDVLLIGTEVFYECKNLKKLPTIVSVSTLCENTFKDCVNLKELTFDGPYKAKIENNTFNNCCNLKNITFLCKVELSNYLIQFLKDVNVKAIQSARDVFDLAYEGYSIGVVVK